MIPAQPEWHARAIELYARGESLTRIGQLLRVSRYCVTRVVMPERIEADSNRRRAERLVKRQTALPMPRKTKANLEVFEKWEKKPTRQLIDEAAIPSAALLFAKGKISRTEFMARITPR